PVRILLAGPLPHAPGLADLLTRDRAGRADADVDAEAQPRVQPLGQPGLRRRRIGLAANLRVHLELEQRAPPIDDDRILRPDRLVLEQDRLDLARVDVDAADDEHVVDAAREAGDPPVRTAARARLVGEARHVAGPDAQDG